MTEIGYLKTTRPNQIKISTVIQHKCRHFKDIIDTDIFLRREIISYHVTDKNYMVLRTEKTYETGTTFFFTKKDTHQTFSYTIENFDVDNKVEFIDLFDGVLMIIYGKKLEIRYTLTNDIDKLRIFPIDKHSKVTLDTLKCIKNFKLWNVDITGSKRTYKLKFINDCLDWKVPSTLYTLNLIAEVASGLILTINSKLDIQIPTLYMSTVPLFEKRNLAYCMTRFS